MRISSTVVNANFATDGIDMALRNMPVQPAEDPALEIDKLVDIAFIPVCSPRLLEKYGPLTGPADLARLPLIHDESLSGRVTSPSWSDWFKAAGLDDVDLRRGLRFNSADHALDAAGEGAGVLLAYDTLAYDDLRMGRLVMPVRLVLPSGRAFYVVWPKNRKPAPAAQAFRRWIKDEMASINVSLR